MKRIVLALLGLVLVTASAYSADDNVRAAQTRLKESGFYFGETNGTLDSDTSAAISRYQIRNGLAITGQLDAETARALGVAAAATSAKAQPQDSGSWQRLRKTDRQFLDRLESTKPGRKPGEVASPAAAPRQRAAAKGTTARGGAQPPAPATAEDASVRSLPPASAPAGSDYGPVLVLSKERLRDYVGAFVLAGLDPRIGAELEFFGDRVDYYNRGTLRRQEIRADLESYARKWPERRFWLAGDVAVQPQADSRVRVTFPLRYEVRNGARRSSGTVRKTLHLEVVGDDLEIVAVNERKM
jgi:peptidoglycan hydrolase-like protein with peptidoglycan-binding domain